MAFVILCWYICRRIDLQKIVSKSIYNELISRYLNLLTLSYLLSTFCTYIVLFCLAKEGAKTQNGYSSKSMWFYSSICVETLEAFLFTDVNNYK